MRAGPEGNAERAVPSGGAGACRDQVMVTLEKIAWLCGEGEQWLRPEKRSAGVMMFYKARARLRAPDCRDSGCEA